VSQIFNSPVRLCVRGAVACAMFSLAGRLPSMPSADSFPSLFGHFVGVGSEEARLRAGLRPPLKLHGRFSRAKCARAHLARYVTSINMWRPAGNIHWINQVMVLDAT